MDWRKAGSLRHKQNVFDDFQACAEHLFAEGYSSPGKLTIQARCPFDFSGDYSAVFGPLLLSARFLLWHRVAQMVDS